MRRYQSLDPKPSEFRRLEFLSQLAAGEPVKRLESGQPVPDFTFIDQRRQRLTFSTLAGSVVALTFTYVRCPDPAYCFRLAGNLSQLQRRFKNRLGKDLVLLTIAIDPGLDQGDALADYARTWTTNAQGWRFLTGPLEDVRRVAGMFGVQFWQDEGSLTHSFHTAVIDRRGTLVGNLDGNEFTAQQLGDLVQTVLERTEDQGADQGLSTIRTKDQRATIEPHDAHFHPADVAAGAGRSARTAPQRRKRWAYARWRAADHRQRARHGLGSHVDQGRAGGDGANLVELLVDIGGAHARHGRLLGEGRRTPGGAVGGCAGAHGGRRPEERSRRCARKQVGCGQLRSRVRAAGKLFENDIVVVWDYTWTLGQPTAMHFHDKDALVVYLKNGRGQIDDARRQERRHPADGGPGGVQPRARVHTETLVEGESRGIITEFK